MKYLEKFLFKYLKLYLLFCLVCFAFVLYKSDYFDETLIILLLFLFFYSISKYIYNKIYEKNVKKIVDVSNNIKNLSELNKKYNFLKIKNKSRVFREREYSVKSYERVLAKDILMYHIENNTDYIREDILNAYKNKECSYILSGIFKSFLSFCGSPYIEILVISSSSISIIMSPLLNFCLVSS